MTTPSPDLGFLPIDDLPPQDRIVALCKAAGREVSGIPLSGNPGEPVIAWVKFGAELTIGEALTQDWVAKKLNEKPETTVRVPRVHAYFSRPSTAFVYGYIVMEYVDAPDCTVEDFKSVAQAVQALIGVRGPNSAPGHVGGGPLIHNFFAVDETSPFVYETVDELERHVNGILRVMELTARVNLVADARDGLFLCPCDIHPGNFKKLPDGSVVALDFHLSCFLPPCFFPFAMKRETKFFARLVAHHVSYPDSDNVEAMLSASYFLVPCQKNETGAPKGLRRYEWF